MKKRVLPVAVILIGSLLTVLGLLQLNTRPDITRGLQGTRSQVEAPTLTVVPEATSSQINAYQDNTLEPENPVFSGERAFEHVVYQVEIGPRPTGSQGSRQTAQYILDHLQRHGWITERRAFTYNDVDAVNLVGKRSLATDQIYIIGAHYDTRREADQDPDNPEQPVLGANDGASGVAVLLELARVLDLQQVNGQVWLVFFDAEDNGYLDGWDYIAGSRQFAETMSIDPAYVIIVDMVGDADQNIYYERNSDDILQTHLFDIAQRLGYGEYFIQEYRHAMLDDHTPFLELGIPAVDIIDFDYPYWHTTQDTLDKVSSDSLERVGRVIEVYLEGGGQYPSR